MSCTVYHRILHIRIIFLTQKFVGMKVGRRYEICFPRRALCVRKIKHKNPVNHATNNFVVPINQLKTSTFCVGIPTIWNTFLNYETKSLTFLPELYIKLKRISLFQ